MTIHSSLSKSASMSRHRSVVKRFERIQLLEKKGDWSEEKGAYGLQKVKMVKLTAKKEKPKAAEGEDAAKTADGKTPAVDAKKETGKKETAKKDSAKK